MIFLGCAARPRIRNRWRRCNSMKENRIDLFGVPPNDISASGGGGRI